MEKIFTSIYTYFKTHLTIFYGLLFIIVLALGLGASRLKIEEDVTKMMPNAGKASEILHTLQDSKLSEKVVFLIHAKNETVSAETLTASANYLNERFGDSLQRFVQHVRCKTNDEEFLDLYALIQRNAPVFLEESDYIAMDSMIAEGNIPKALENDYRMLSSASGIVLKEQILKDPIGITGLVLKKMNQLQFNDNIVLQDGYFFTKDMQNVLMVLTPSFASNNSKVNEQFIVQLKNQIAALQKAYPDCEVQYYGASPVAYSNAVQLKKDTFLTLTITVVGLLAFIWFYFRKKRIPLIVFFPVLFGALLALCMIAITKGSISTIALAAGCVILGIGINYALHFINHYKHSHSIKDTIGDLIEPLSIGSFTTVASFFSLQFVHSPILADFGLFAGWTLIGTSIFTLLFLPVFVPEFSEETTSFERFTTIKYTPNKWVALGITVLTVVFLFFVNRVQFDSDLNQLSYQTDELKGFEKAMNALQGDSVKTVYISTKGATLDEALNQTATLAGTLASQKENHHIENYSAISAFVIPEAEQQKRIARWNAYWSDAKRQTVISGIKSASGSYHFKPEAFQVFYDLLNSNPKQLAKAETDLIIHSIGTEQIAQTHDGYAVLSSVLLKKANRAVVYPELEQLKGVTILDKAIVTNSLIESVYTDFNKILLYTSLIVFLALLISYGRIELALITFIPMAVTWIWILGIMGLFGLKFNIVNIIISTFIFGLGDDFSIFITDGLTQKFKSGKDVLSSHKSSIFLATVTTILGLGALIFAKHPALKSIAWLSMLGLLCVIIIGQTIQPLLYNYFIQNRKEKGFAPWTLPTLLLASVAFMYFVIGGFVLALIGFPLIYLLPFPSKAKRKYIYHVLLSNFVKSLVYMMANVRKVHINKELADFSTPSVIISNHQSFLDILITVMQHPKIILLTNEWVYNSPFFGQVVKLGDYYPVADGAEGAIERLQKKVSEGYSIVIFPEGTRSADGKMKRFKKGAFFLAEQLNLDIQPLLLHGINHTMGKGDFMLFNGQMTLKYLPRIKPSDTTFGVGYSERTKNISQYFKDEFEKLRVEIEQPLYFKQRLEMNYVYKGPVLEWYTWKKIQLENYYKTYHDVLPRQGTITDLGCGYGYMAYMLNFICPDRVITGVDYDEPKIDVANNNYSKNPNLNFYASSITEISFVPQDAYVINDVLHYLKYDEQEKVIANCIQHLNPNGILIIKDANVEDEKGQKVTWLSEFFSTNFGFNKMGHGELFFTSQNKLQVIADKYGMTLSILEAPKYSSNTIWLLKRK